MTNFESEYNQAAEAAANALRISEHANDTYGCGTAFVTVIYKKNPKFYNWGKKVGLLQKDAYYGAILDTSNGLRLALPGGTSIGTIAQEYYNKAFANEINKRLDIGAFNHTRLD